VIKQVTAIVVLSCLAVIFQGAVHHLLSFIVIAYDLAAQWLHRIFSSTHLAVVILEVLVIVSLPLAFSVGVVFCGRVARYDCRGYLTTMMWGFWLVMVTLLIQQGRLS
jgi:hypothetical protein